MFISKQEKVDILNRIIELEKAVALLPREKTDQEIKKSTSGWTDAARARHSERLKKAWALKKEQEIK
jgi:hypothetical protein